MVAAAMEPNMHRMDQLTSDFYERYAAGAALSSEASRSAMLPFVEAALARGASVLDVGSGSGRDVAAMLDLGLDAFGVEPSGALRERAALMRPALRDRLCEGMLPELGQPFRERHAKGFDAVVCSAVLMHLSAAELPLALGALVAQLRPLTIDDTAHHWPALLVAIPEMDRALLVADRDGDGRRFYNHDPIELCHHLAAHGLVLERAEVNDAVLASSGTRWHSLVFRRSG